MVKFKSILTLLIFLLASTLLSQTEIKFYEDRKLMRDEMLRHIPLESDTSVARKVLTNANFIHLEWMKDSDFMAGKDLYSHIDFLYANHEQYQLLLTLRWQFAIVQEKGKVKDILVSFGTIGL